MAALGRVLTSTLADGIRGQGIEESGQDHGSAGEHARGTAHRASGAGHEESLEGQLPTLVPIAALRPSDSPRAAGEDPQHVHALAELDVPLPPIVVHRSTMRVIDGMHRLRVAQIRGEEHVQVVFYDGSDQDAFVLAVRLNTTHGLPLSRADRARAAARMIQTHPQWSDRLIASAAGIATKTVRALRERSTEHDAQLNGDPWPNGRQSGDARASESQANGKRVGRDGRARPLSAAEGRRRASELMAQRPDASLREISEAAGIALATTRDVRERIRLGQDPVPPKLRAAEQKKERRVAPRIEPPRIPADAVAALEVLRRDPSLRFTEVGRRLMFLLSIHSISAQEWQWLVKGVPSHCSRTVAQVARQCAQQWLDFADQVEARGRLAG